MTRFSGFAVGLLIVGCSVGCCYVPGYYDPCTGCTYGGYWEPMPGGSLGSSSAWLGGADCCCRGGSIGSFNCENACCKPHNCAQTAGGYCGSSWEGTYHAPVGSYYAGQVYPPHAAYFDEGSIHHDPAIEGEIIYDVPEEAIYSGAPISPEQDVYEHAVPVPEPAPAAEPAGDAADENSASSVPPWTLDGHRSFVHRQQHAAGSGPGQGWTPTR